MDTDDTTPPRKPGARQLMRNHRASGVLIRAGRSGPNRAERRRVERWYGREYTPADDLEILARRAMYCADDAKRRAARVELANARTLTRRSSPVHPAARSAAEKLDRVQRQIAQRRGR